MMAQSMEQSIVAVFDNRTSAQQAMDELVASGVKREQVRLSEARAPGDTLPAAGSKPILSHIFGAEHSDESRLYDAALRQGNTALTVVAGDDDQADLAITVLGRFKPVDLEQHAGASDTDTGAGAGMPGRDAVGAPPVAVQRAQPMSMQGESRQGASVQGVPVQGVQGEQGAGMPGSASALSQQFAPPGATSSVGSQQDRGGLEGGRGAVRVYRRLPPEASEALPGAMLDKYFRTHWNRNYASHGHTFDDYAPAYQYGSRMAESAQFGGAQWDEVEAAVKLDWQGKNPGAAWEKFKAAIRHGWEGSAL